MKKIFILSLILSPLFNYAQTITVTGRVQDESGSTLPIATLKVKGKSIATSADKDGNFTIPYVLNNDYLICSHAGYLNKEEKIEGNTTIIFTLEKDKQYFYSATIPVDKSHTDFNKQDLVKDRVDRIFTKVEVRAAYSGGEYGFNRDFQKIFKWPDSAKIIFNNSIIKLGLTINKDGSLKKITVIKGINAPINKAVTDAIIKMHAWQPAIQNGRKSEDYYEVSLKFAATE